MSQGLTVLDSMCTQVLSRGHALWGESLQRSTCRASWVCSPVLPFSRRMLGPGELSYRAIGPYTALFMALARLGALLQVLSGVLTCLPWVGWGVVG